MTKTQTEVDEIGENAKAPCLRCRKESILDKEGICERCRKDDELFRTKYGFCTVCGNRAKVDENGICGWCI